MKDIDLTKFRVYRCPTKKVDRIKGPTYLSIIMCFLTPDWKSVTVATPVSVLKPSMSRKNRWLVADELVEFEK